MASDFNSTDGTAVNVGSGRFSEGMSYGDDALRGPATSDGSVRTNDDVLAENTTTPSGVGREGHDALEGLPKDAKES